MQTEPVASWNIPATQGECNTSGKTIRLVSLHHFLLICNPFSIPFCSEMSSAASGGDGLAATEIKSSHSTPCPLPVHSLSMPDVLFAAVTSSVRLKDTWDQDQMSEPTLKVEKSHETLLFYGRRPRTEHVGESRVLCLSWEKDIKEHRGS